MSLFVPVNLDSSQTLCSLKCQVLEALMSNAEQKCGDSESLTHCSFIKLEEEIMFLNLTTHNNTKHTEILKTQPNM